MVKSKPSMTASAGADGLFESFASANAAERDTWNTIKVNTDEAARLESMGLNGDTLYQVWMEQTGAYGNPTVLDQDEFNDYIFENDLQPMYRGRYDTRDLFAVDMHENAMYDQKYYVGEGVFGDGLYFGSETTAMHYACEYGNFGAVIQAALKPGAKVAVYDDIADEYARKFPQYLNQDKFPDDGLLSVYARLHGYDAILETRPEAGGFPYTCVLNRDMLVISSRIRDVNNRGEYI